MPPVKALPIIMGKPNANVKQLLQCKTGPVFFKIKKALA